jgi:dTDP-4-dehydrorhamnose reductase
MRVLLLGKHGQVGWELQRVLASCAETIAPARAELDLGRPQELRDAVRAARPDVIVNAAAYTAVDLAEDDPAAAFATNAEAIRPTTSSMAASPGRTRKRTRRIRSASTAAASAPVSSPSRRPAVPT